MTGQLKNTVKQKGYTKRRKRQSTPSTQFYRGQEAEATPTRQAS
jgi:hypothetical protein